MEETKYQLLHPGADALLAMFAEKNMFQVNCPICGAKVCRAAECSLYFDHTRPNGESFYSVCAKASGENIAAGQQCPTAFFLRPDTMSGGIGRGDQWLSICL